MDTQHHIMPTRLEHQNLRSFVNASEGVHKNMAALSQDAYNLMCANMTSNLSTQQLQQQQQQQQQQTWHLFPAPKGMANRLPRSKSTTMPLRKPVLPSAPPSSPTEFGTTFTSFEKRQNYENFAEACRMAPKNLRHRRLSVSSQEQHEDMTNRDSTGDSGPGLTDEMTDSDGSLEHEHDAYQSTMSHLFDTYHQLSGSRCKDQDFLPRLPTSASPQKVKVMQHSRLPSIDKSTFIDRSWASELSSSLDIPLPSPSYPIMQSQSHAMAQAKAMLQSNAQASHSTFEDSFIVAPRKSRSGRQAPHALALLQSPPNCPLPPLPSLTNGPRSALLNRSRSKPNMKLSSSTSRENNFNTWPSRNASLVTSSRYPAWPPSPPLPLVPLSKTYINLNASFPTPPTNNLVSSQQNPPPLPPFSPSHPACALSSTSSTAPGFSRPSTAPAPCSPVSPISQLSSPQYPVLPAREPPVPPMPPLEVSFWDHSDDDDAEPPTPRSLTWTTGGRKRSVTNSRMTGSRNGSGGSGTGSGSGTSSSNTTITGLGAKFHIRHHSSGSGSKYKLAGNGEELGLVDILKVLDAAAAEGKEKEKKVKKTAGAVLKDVFSFGLASKRKNNDNDER